jgi:5-oxopent-3-ene-1,2,5-tricarboxylate decarboxylase / 2-hydroxyhepta-2,4-diene-1,7-dioate isomerase
MTLEAGDLILTGTPTGSSVVEPGDVVEVEVDSGDYSSGRLRRPIEEGSAPLSRWGAMPAVDDGVIAAAYSQPVGRSSS